jgi:hypothetical protein
MNCFIYTPLLDVQAKNHFAYHFFAHHFGSHPWGGGSLQRPDLSYKVVIQICL